MPRVVGVGEVETELVSPETWFDGKKIPGVFLEESISIIIFFLKKEVFTF